MANTKNIPSRLPATIFLCASARTTSTAPHKQRAEAARKPPPPLGSAVPPEQADASRYAAGLACGTPEAAATSAAKSDASFSMPSPSWKRT